MKKLILLVLLTIGLFELQVNPKPIYSNNVLSWVCSCPTEELNFDEAYKQIEKWEGGYANDPNDNGGETYCGISRVSHPNWSGWIDIENCKPLKWNQKIGIDYKVYSFYKRIYWDGLKISQLGNQLLAEEFFDITVNIGFKGAKSMFTEAYNLLTNRCVEELSMDEIISISYKYKDNQLFMSNIVKLMNGLQLNRYISISKLGKKQYLSAWLKRI
jgi:hypothetical protein